MYDRIQSDSSRSQAWRGITSYSPYSEPYIISHFDSLRRLFRLSVSLMALAFAVTLLFAFMLTSRMESESRLQGGYFEPSTGHADAFKHTVGTQKSAAPISITCVEANPDSLLG